MNLYHPHSMVVICPDSLRQTLLDLGQGMTPPVIAGLNMKLWGPHRVSGVDGIHWAELTRASPTFCQVMQNMAYPDPMPVGVTEEMISGVLSQCYVDVTENIDGQNIEQHEQYATALTTHGFVDYNVQFPPEIPDYADEPQV